MLNVYSVPFWYLFPCLGLSYRPSGKSAYTQLSFLQHCVLKTLIYIALSRFLSPSSQLKRPLVSTWIPAHYTWNVSRDYGQLYGSSHLVFPSTQITILKRLMSSVWNLLLHTHFVQILCCFWWEDKCGPSYSNLVKKPSDFFLFAVMIMKVLWEYINSSLTPIY